MTLREFRGLRSTVAPRVVATLAIAGLIGLGACNEEKIPYYNGPGHITATPLGVQDALFYVLQPRPDVGNWAVWSSGLMREATYFTPSEERFVTELTGQNAIQPDDFIGATVWDQEFSNVKTADSADAVLAAAGFGVDSIRALWAEFETGKALNFMFPLLTRDTLGEPLGAVGQSSPPYAPFLCNTDAWTGIVAMLDSSIDSLSVGPFDTTMALPTPLPLGLANLAGSPTTPHNFASLTFALRAKARIELAYAIARAGGGNPLPAGGLTGAALAQIDSAQFDVDSAVLIQSIPGPHSTTPATDGGVFYTFSTQANDVINPIFNFIKGYYALQPFVDGINTADARFTAKFTLQPSRPSAPSAQLVIANGDTIGSAWNYSIISAASPEPLVRSLELQFMDARIQLAEGNLTGAIDTINLVRTAVGRVSARSVVATPDSVASFIVSEAQLSFIGEGTSQDVMAMRDYELQPQYLTTWGSADLATAVLPIPITETQPRGGDVTPTCSGAASTVVSRPSSGKAKAKAATAKVPTILRLH